MPRRRTSATRPEYALSPEALRQQLIRANDKNALLEGRVAALRATLRRDPDPLLIELAQALHLAREISDPQQAHSYDPTGIRHSAEPPMPGANTANQRRAANHLRTQLHRAINEFENARQRNWESRERIPKIRCRNRHCSRLDVRVPAWDHRGKANEFCPGCGNRYQNDQDPVT